MHLFLNSTPNTIEGLYATCLYEYRSSKTKRNYHKSWAQQWNVTKVKKGRSQTQPSRATLNLSKTKQ